MWGHKTPSGHAGGRGADPYWPVFNDPTHRRVRVVAVIFALMLSATVFFVASIVSNLLSYPALETDALRPVELQPEFVAGPPLDLAGLRDRLGCHDGEDPVDCAARDSAGFLADLDALDRASLEVFAYLPAWPDWRPVSVENHANDVDVLLAQLYTLDAQTGEMTDLGSEDAGFLRAKHALWTSEWPGRILPVVQVGRAGAEAPIAPGLLQDMAGALADETMNSAVNGLCLEPEGDVAKTYPQMQALMAAVEAHPGWGGRMTCLIVPMSGIWSIPEDAGETFDRVVLSRELQAVSNSYPSPAAPQSDIEALARALAERPDRDLFVVSLATDALQWRSDTGLPERMSYAQAMANVARAGATMEFAGTSGHCSAAFVDDAGRANVIWVEDLVSTYRKVKVLRDAGIASFAVWPVGGEDPGVWSVLSDSARNRSAVNAPDLSSYVFGSGEGAFIGYAGLPRAGLRVVRDATGLPVCETLIPPSPHQIIRWGEMAPQTIMLTFDDGPDPVWTEEVLDVLEEKGVKATFFLVGEKVSSNAQVVQRILDDGHVIGSHSYFHPRFDASPLVRINLEAALMQKVLDTTISRSTRVMRIPYARGMGPLDSSEVAPIAKLSELGYLLVLGDIVPPDWGDLPSDEIVDHVLAKSESGLGKVLILHDGGGDRENVVEALPRLIDAMRARGYSFVGLPEVLGTTADDLMPTVETKLGWQDRVTFYALDGTTGMLKISFWVVIAIGVLRSLAVVIMAEARRPHRPEGPGERPQVDVLVPAYCEEGVVVAAIEAILRSDYENLRVIAVDDGSSDDTLAVLRQHFGHHPRVRVLTKVQGGKSSALNYALARSDAEVVVAIDADTLLDPKAVGLLVRHFRDPRIGAVAGNVKVGNRVNLLTRFQALEYITSQNMDRRAAELVNGMLVVPGSIGAWRRAAIEAAGGYPLNTLAEDADLTVAVNRAGYRVVYEPAAIAHTEAPETLRQLFRQRLRWVLGMMQVGWKHKGAVFKRRGLGFYSLPDLFLFGVVMPLLAPLADLIFLMAVLSAAVSLAMGHGFVLPTEVHWTMLAAYMGLPFLDLLVAALAFHFEPEERKSLMWLHLIQRFFYRQVLYIATIRAFLHAISGRVMGWQKVVRTSSLIPDRAPQRELAPALAHKPVEQDVRFEKSA